MKGYLKESKMFKFKKKKKSEMSEKRRYNDMQDK